MRHGNQEMPEQPQPAILDEKRRLRRKRRVDIVASVMEKQGHTVSEADRKLMMVLASADGADSLDAEDLEDL